MSLHKFARLVIDLEDRKSDAFSGIGLVLYKDIHKLPISPLKLVESSLELTALSDEAILRFLLTISAADHPFHDGFHFISESFRLTHIAQYFSTPIVPGANIEYYFGSRHRPALYGSFLEDVLACGVLGNGNEPVIFVRGSKFNPNELL